MGLIKTIGEIMQQLQVDGDTLYVDADNNNVGIDVTPRNDWHSNYTVLQVGGETALWATTTPGASATTFLSNNFYYDGAWKRIFNDQASYLTMSDDQLSYLTSPAGVINTGVTPTQVLSISSAGDTVMAGTLGCGAITVSSSADSIFSGTGQFGIGATPGPSFKFDVKGETSDYTKYAVRFRDSNDVTLISARNDGAISMPGTLGCGAITSTGDSQMANLGIGYTPGTVNLHVQSSNVYTDGILLSTNATVVTGLGLWYDNTNNISYIEGRWDHANDVMKIRMKGNGTPVDAITINSTGNVTMGGTLGCGAITSTGAFRSTITGDTARFIATSGVGTQMISIDAQPSANVVAIEAEKTGAIGYPTLELWNSGAVALAIDASKNTTLAGTLGCGEITSNSSNLKLSHPTSTGAHDSVVSYTLRDSIGSQIGLMGFASASNDEMYIMNEVGGLLLATAGVIVMEIQTGAITMGTSTLGCGAITSTGAAIVTAAVTDARIAQFDTSVNLAASESAFITMNDDNQGAWEQGVIRNSGDTATMGYFGMRDHGGTYRYLYFDASGVLKLATTSINASSDTGTNV